VWRVEPKPVSVPSVNLFFSFANKGEGGGTKKTKKGWGDDVHMYLGCIYVCRVLLHRRARVGVLNSRIQNTGHIRPSW
jgi:hypothetical protein